MNEKELTIWEQYNLNVIRTYKGRGSIICETDKGIKMLRELSCHRQRIEFQAQIQSLLRRPEHYQIDYLLKNAAGEWVTRERDDTAYIVKDWFEGREIDVKNKGEVMMAVRKLALIHTDMILGDSASSLNHRYEDLEIDFEKHNKELKKVRNFIRAKNKKTDYEICFIGIFEMFSKDGLEALERLKGSAYGRLREEAAKKGCVCHGDYNHHNILITRGAPAITNFDRCRVGVQAGDLYTFMRKILEKHRWNTELGMDMLSAYNEVRELSEAEWENLLIRFIYPEKFWKIANHYYNSNKAWTPVKNIEKLEMLAEQNKEKWSFMERAFSGYL